MNFSLEIVLLVISILFFLSIIAGKASSKFGVPALLLFLAVGMLFGSDGIGIQFSNIHMAQNIGSLALCIILFSGGLDTKFVEIKPIASQGIILATLGVFVTALISGVLVYWVLNKTIGGSGIGFLTALLIASIMSSTDSASVFSILRSRGLNLKNNLRPLLELESGSNDPMAYVIVITLIEVIKMGENPNLWVMCGTLLLQLGIGASLGYFLGKFAIIVINRIKIGNDSLYPILVITFCIFIFSITYFMNGNGFLSVYIAGLVIGNSKFVHKRSTLNFFDGIAWMFQLIMFLTLGLLVNPHELIPIIIPGLIISLLMIFVSRPITVFLCLTPFRNIKFKDKLFLSWVGLRGAVPIIFAIFPLVENIPNARLIFNIVFFCTLISLIIQGTSLSVVANWLKLSTKPKFSNKLKNFDIDFSSDIKSVTTEIEISPSILLHGNMLMNLPLPENTLAVMVKRDEKFFVPTGKTVLKEKDKVLFITDNEDALLKTYEKLGISNV
ncbi:MAG: potassium/proton antiporter [Flavobacteriales bacterium]|nr:potassium/proton antiporter [Flavobacteriales bacterium]